MTVSSADNKSPIVVALDFPDSEQAINMAERLNPQECRVKVGKELFTSAGPAVVEKLQGAAAHSGVVLCRAGR